MKSKHHKRVYTINYKLLCKSVLFTYSYGFVTDLFIKLYNTRLANGTLNRTLGRINDDIYTKTNSLNLDQQCLDIREKLSEHPKIQQILQIVEEKMKEQ